MRSNVFSYPNSSYGEYLSHVEGFCPFLKPSRDKNLSWFTEYNIDEYGIEKFAEIIFYTGLIHTEILRVNRKKYPSDKILYSENIVFKVEEKNLNGEEVFSWPHWCLKTLYTKTGILFGKFWDGEEDIAKNGFQLPVPPLHFLSIRSAIKKKDKRFFEKATSLLDDFEMAEDDGADVVEVANVWDKEIKSLVKSFISDKDIDSAPEELLPIMLNSGMYDKAIEYSKNVEY